ncbi:MAG: 3'-5' exonuclease [Clostridia bacterium]|nr:3'-5' exonuclease [Clostridia bacterium]
MSLIVFDTETTAPSPGQICQLAYLVIDGRRATGKNYFFTVDEMTPRAQAVHGLSPEALKALSGGLRFADRARDILSDFAACDALAGHGAAFDDLFLRAELARCGLALGEKPLFCTRDFYVRLTREKYGRRVGWPSLSRLAEAYGLAPDTIASRAEAWFGGGAAAHDARYDAAAAWLVTCAAMERGELDMNLIAPGIIGAPAGHAEAGGAS